MKVAAIAVAISTLISATATARTYDTYDALMLIKASTRMAAHSAVCKDPSLSRMSSEFSTLARDIDPQMVAQFIGEPGYPSTYFRHVFRETEAAISTYGCRRILQELRGPVNAHK